jgi:hypothetical protein
MGFWAGLARIGAIPVGLSLGPLLLVLLAPRSTAAAPRCTTLRFAFQPQCFEPGPCPGEKRKLGDRLDLPPQVAVWIEAADRSRFVDTVMVTNLTARYGLGNRPGLWNLPSGPRHPYGKRLMALPVWAWSRGQLYPQVVMQDGHEEWMGFHEQISSPDPYYCRPMGIAEVDVDAISCPTKVFNSAKGKLAADLPQIPYPPRNDISGSHANDCDSTSSREACSKSVERFAVLNDLDAVAAASPPFARLFEGRWALSPQLHVEADYALMVEVNREFDQNASYREPAYEDKMLTQNGFTQTGLRNNLGQPSVVYRVPFRIDGQTRLHSTDVAAGYGSADGASGSLRAPDSTISQAPGSGEGRLASIPLPWTDVGAGGPGKVFVRLDDCGEGPDPGGECEPLPAAPPPVTDMVVIDPQATTAVVEFRHPAIDGDQPVIAYDIRRHAGSETSEQNFLEGVPVERVEPGPPGTMTSFKISDLKPLTKYVVAVRVLGRCGTRSQLVQVPFETKDLYFKQLTGCFVASAAHGSALAPALAPLRQARDRLRAGSALGAATTALYESASPPMAAVLSDSPAARAVVRRLLAPAAALVTGLEQ